MATDDQSPGQMFSQPSVVDETSAPRFTPVKRVGNNPPRYRQFSLFTRLRYFVSRYRMLLVPLSLFVVASWYWGRDLVPQLRTPIATSPAATSPEQSVVQRVRIPPPATATANPLIDTADQALTAAENAVNAARDQVRREQERVRAYEERLAKMEQALAEQQPRRTTTEPPPVANIDASSAPITDPELEKLVRRRLEMKARSDRRARAR